MFSSQIRAFSIMEALIIFIEGDTWPNRPSPTWPNWQECRKPPFPEHSVARPTSQKQPATKFGRQRISSISRYPKALPPWHPEKPCVSSSWFRANSTSGSIPECSKESTRSSRRSAMTSHRPSSPTAANWTGSSPSCQKAATRTPSSSPHSSSCPPCGSSSKPSTCQR